MQWQQRQTGSRLNTAASYPAIFSVQWLLRHWVLWQMRLSITRDWQEGNALHSRSTGSYISIPVYFWWQFSISMQCDWPIRCQFPSPHRNHSRHKHYTLLISKSLANEVPWALQIIIIIMQWNNNDNNLTKYRNSISWLITTKYSTYTHTHK